MNARYKAVAAAAATMLLVGTLTALADGDRARAAGSVMTGGRNNVGAFDRIVRSNIAAMTEAGRQTFRFDTFGDEAFWGDQLQLHTAIEGSKLGGVGAGISPNQALALGLKVDVDALSGDVLGALRSGRANLDDAATTLALLKANAVIGLTGFFNANGTLKSIGIQCALCHSTVDNSLAFGIGHRLDGWSNHDLDIGKIIASAPNLGPFVTLLSVTQPGITANDVRSVLQTWGPGKFDAELILDGKTFNPAQVTDGVTTGTNDGAGRDAHSQCVRARGLQSAHLDGRVGDRELLERLRRNARDAWRRTVLRSAPEQVAQFPIAAAFGFGNLNAGLNPDDDRVTQKLPALHFYQLALPAPTPQAGVDFDATAAKRGDNLFSGKAGCNGCHVDPLWTEPGWNLHTAADVCIDDFEANRAPDHSYKTMNLNGLFVREEGLFMNPANKGRYYHDGRFKTLLDVVNHYNTCKSLGLTDQEKHDLVEYLKSLPES